MARGVEDDAVETDDADREVVGEVSVGWGDFRGGDAEPAGLDIHHFDQGQIKLVVEDGCSGEAFELLGSGDVVDVGVCDDDLLEGELVACEGGDDAGDVVAGIDDDGLVGGFVAENGAVAAERANYEDFVDHVGILEGLERRVAIKRRCASLRPAHPVNRKMIESLLDWGALGGFGA